MLALRDIIMIDVGMGEQPEGVAALARLGSRSPLHGMDSYRVAFWVPLPPGHPKATRDVTRSSVVPDVSPLELQAIRDGAVEEVVLEWSCEKAAPQEWRARAMKAAWWNLARHRAGGKTTRQAAAPVIALPNGSPRGPEQLAARDYENRKLTLS
jgi:hypothetical protein